MVATRRFKTSAVGRIIGVGVPRKAIAARYADAPAWPTDEYKIAAARNATVSNRTDGSGTERV
jgi:hypothetical protein